MKRYYQIGGVLLLIAMAIVAVMVIVTPPMRAKATGMLIFAGHVYEPNPNPPPTWIPSDGAYVYVEKAPWLSDYTPCEQNNHGSYCNYDGVQGGFTSCVFARKTINGVYHEDWAFL